MIRGFEFIPGIPAAGHVTAGGYWHPGGQATCPKCDTKPAPPTRGANLMNGTITQDGQPVTEQDPDRCQAEIAYRDFDGSRATAPCTEPATHRPVMDDIHSATMRLAGHTDEELQPHELPLCDEHYEQLHVDIAEQEDNDPYRVWIAAEPCAIKVGYTKQPVLPDGDSDEERYSPYIDGYRPGAEQHVLDITVPLPPKLAPHQVADLVFYATNAPDLAGDPWAGAIRKAIDATGYKGREAGHFSLSVGDTVTVDGIQLACKAAGWGPAEEGGR